MPGAISAANGPHSRIRARYQRGPSVSGVASGRTYGGGAAPGGGATGGSEGYGDDTEHSGYGLTARVAARPPTPSDPAVVAGAAVVAVAVWSGSVAVALAASLVAALVAALAVTLAGGRRSVQRGSRRGLVIGPARWFLVLALLASVGAVRSQHGWAGLAPDRLGPFEGWVRLVDDPQRYPSSTRVIVEVEGERFEIWSRGRAQQQRIHRWRGGQWVAVSGERGALDAERAGRVAWQHVVGEFTLDWASDVHPGDALARASNRVRAAIERAAAVLPEPDGALFRGLVVGDDRDQPFDMIQRFRASGLSHLTAVSGQNVAYVLAACGPLLLRLRPWPRWVVTVGVIAWFVALTRFEPSILRAGVMAGLSATAFVTGRDRAPVRILAIAVTGLVLVDPLLVWSIGFWLSVGATAGVSTLGPWLAARFSGLGPFALPLGITLGAQAGVVIPSVLVFGRLPLVSVPANLLAVPVAGAVMLYGMPAGLLAGWFPALAPVLMLPARFGTRWVDTVALLGARLEPGHPWPWVGWSIVVVVAGAVVVRTARRDKNRGLHGDASSDR
jgi:competence protein ComEC